MVINRENDMELDQFYHHHIPASVGGCEIKILTSGWWQVPVVQ